MAKDHGNIPENCDKILFAEDMVSHIFSRKLQVCYQPKLATPYREFIYEGFDKTVKAAVDDIYKRIVSFNAVFNVENQPLNRLQFHRFAMFMLKKYFTEGFDPKYFFFYSINLSMAAASMVSAIGLQSAGDLAVKYVMKGFRNHDMFTGGWDVLHIMASKYANQRDFMEDITPDIEMMRLPDVGDDVFFSDEEDSEEDNELQNAEAVNVLDNEKEELNCDKKIEDGEQNCYKKIEDGEQNCDKKIEDGEQNVDKKIEDGEQNYDEKIEDGEQNSDKKIEDGEHNCDKKIEDGEQNCDKTIKDGEQNYDKKVEDGEQNCDKIEDENNSDKNIEDDEQNCEKKIEIDEHICKKKLVNDKHNCDKNKTLKTNWKELENSEIKICLEELKVVIEKDVEPGVFQTNSIFNLTSNSKSNSPTDEQNNMYTKDNLFGLKKSPKRDYNGVKINRTIDVSDISSNFSSCDLMNSDFKLEESSTELLENKLSISKRIKIICEETSFPN